MDDAPRLVFYFDYVDPGSYLTHRQLGQLLPMESKPLPTRSRCAPVPQELIDGMDPDWTAYGRTVEGLAREAEIRMAHPTFVPWSRKAHELRLHAAEQGLESPMHEEIFWARFQEGRTSDASTSWSRRQKGRARCERIESGARRR